MLAVPRILKSICQVFRGKHLGETQGELERYILEP